ncbi:LysR family transcriptional regulator [Aliidongia dinghuensis]|uniref:LysR family transcriptional regulator n=1 Tax=Aliidongia dinghuensis TaxID=1867774 RepID=A0A8J3E5G0_9PROT|nr:transcriptional regulator GcvA [Aliidongia dinghuensis]GGF35088.1 LysR family transcriptional regulator [Aliidongia dinghuensis]
MERRLPPLNGLRAFEAAARLLSFTRAAAELSVTQSAVSHQIRGLEDRLGIALFKRMPGALVLSEAGEALLPIVADAFDRLAEGVASVIEHEVKGVLTVNVSPSFAVRWLAPRLGRFRERFPGIELHLLTSNYYTDFAREGVDAAIRHGDGAWPGLHADRFLDDQVYPVCSPKLLEGPHALKAPENLRHHVLLDLINRPYWPRWLAAAGVPDLKPRDLVLFDDIGFGLEAAIAGMGIAMGRSTILGDDLLQGRLVRPFALDMPGRYGFYLVCPEAIANRPKIARLRAWLKDEGSGGA